MKTSLAETQTLTNNTLPFYVWAPNGSVVTYNYPSCYFRWIDLCAIVSHSPLSTAFALLLLILQQNSLLVLQQVCIVKQFSPLSSLHSNHSDNLSSWQINCRLISDMYIDSEEYLVKFAYLFIQDPTLKVRFHLMNAGSWTLLAWTVLFKSITDKNDIILTLF